MILHNFLGNCCSGPFPSEMCSDHGGQFRGECRFCPPCEECDAEWESAASDDRPRDLDLDEPDADG